LLFRGAFSSQRWPKPYLRYSLHLPTEKWPGSVGLSDRNKNRDGIDMPNVVTNPYANRARRSLTFFVDLTNAVTATPNQLRLRSAMSAHNQMVYRPLTKSFTACCASSLVIVTRWQSCCSDLQYESASFQFIFVVTRRNNVRRREGSTTGVK